MNEKKLRDYLKRATVDLRQANRRVLELEEKNHEPIAIVSAACRFPGGADSPEKFWDQLASGLDSVSVFPKERGWDTDSLYDTDPESRGKTYTREGGFIEGAELFDADFFGISPREALALDPQQRLLLEISWETLERAGIDPQSLRGTKTGVFAGTNGQDYLRYSESIPASIEGYAATSGSASVISGRISYTLGLEGPAVTVDTACSSSLVTIHLAAQALRSEECSLALAGGVTVMSSPAAFIEFSRQRGLAPDGRCKAFAASADGTGWGEGVGLVLLERLSDAQRNGHPILAVIRGSAVNQDGASNGLTAPNGPSQQRVIRAALANARLTPTDVDAVEAHGTGTTLGDPIEAQALLATYGQNRPDNQPLWLGSVKSNIGHTQAAAGIAGVIKMVMALQHGVLPQTLHIDEPSPHVDWEAGAVSLLTEPTPWPQTDRPRRAGVSSFGISGTNAHLILEAAPATDPNPETADLGTEDPTTGRPAPAWPVVAWPVSARSPEALTAQAEQLLEHATHNPDTDIADIGHALATTRAHHTHRAVALGTNRDELLDALRALSRREEHPGLVQGPLDGTATGGGKTVFVFPGQGSQYPGMGRDLYALSPVFRDHIHACDEALAPHTGWSLTQLLTHHDGEATDLPPFDRVDVVQPALFAVLTGLAACWKATGIHPDTVLGHSQGEIAAAYTAGALTLTDATTIVALRAQALADLSGTGTMATLTTNPDHTQTLIQTLTERTGLSDLHIAAVNGPQSTVISGHPDAITALLALCESEGVRARQIPVDYASHSPHIDPLADRLRAALAHITPQPTSIGYCSGMTGDLIDPSQLTGEYWFTSMRQPVRFHHATQTLLNTGHRLFIESSPHPVLTPALTQTTTHTPTPVTITGTLRRDHNPAHQFTTALATAHTHGTTPTWHTLHPHTHTRPVDLPTYPFQHHPYWLHTPTTTGDPTSLGLAATTHPFLGAIIDTADDRTLFTGRISLTTHPWLNDHAVAGTTLLPGTAYLDLALHAATHTGHHHVQELTLHQPLVLTDTPVDLQVTVDAQGQITIHSRPAPTDTDDADPTWTTHATGQLTTDTPPVPHETATTWPPPEATPIELDDHYDRFADIGVDYGPTFQGLTAAWRHGNDLYAEVTLPEDTDTTGHGIHPALLDAALQVSAHTSPTDEANTTPVMPFSWTGITLHTPTTPTTLRAHLTPTNDTSVAIALTNETGEPVATIQTLTVRPVDPAQLATTAQPDDSLYELTWQSLPITATEPSPTPTPPPVIAHLTAPPDTDPLTATHTLTHHTLALLQNHLADDALADTRLVLLTHGAIAATHGEDITDLAAAATWGLVRSAQNEHPDRILLIDTDQDTPTPDTLAALLTTGEPQLALRNGNTLVPRLTRTTTGDTTPPTLNPNGTILITGGTGTLATATARHLVTHHGARHLLLASRSGPNAPGAHELQAELTAHGAHITLTTCDTGNPHQLTALLNAIPNDHPLTAVIHTAGTLHDATLHNLTPDHIDTVLHPKADTAWHLHHLTKDLDLAAFVLYSSAAGTLGNPGQAAYATANTFLDALATHRHTHGQPATSLAWDTSAENPLPIGEILDAALAAALPVALPLRPSRAALRAQAEAGTLSPLFFDLVSTTSRRARRPRATSLTRQLAGLTAEEQLSLLLDQVRDRAASVLGHSGPEAIGPDRPFQDLGFDSLTAVELRNRLNTATGLRLPATLVFDHPTPTALARYLHDELLGAANSSSAATTAAVALSNDPIVIVSMACRFPGGADTPEAFWQQLVGGQDVISGFPDNRGWDLDNLYDPDPDQPGRTYAREGGFIYDVDQFDPAFFGISPREAVAMDPQQRLLLETSWEALERAGIVPASLRGSNTGAYAGISAQHFGGDASRVPDGLEGYLLTGTATSVASGRIAYTLGLEGPAVTIDTACSSSLVAIHMAAQALRSGECELALAGGVAVMVTPGTFVEFSRQRVMARDGRCKAFAAAADGAGFSEGAGMVLLERLSDAQRNGHPVLAVIRGSAINQDGASNGLTAPNGPSQQRVIRAALANARLTPADVDAVEAHGTGTTLGDPIEAQALLATYGQDRPDNQPLWLGSVKSNIGHTQAAAGMAGLIKMVMAMQHGLLPQTLHVDAPSPHIDWEAGAVSLLTEPTPWPETNRPRRAGISSFGISGTNAHLIVEAPPAPPTPAVPAAPDTADQEPAWPVLSWPLSGKTPAALHAQATRLHHHLTTHPHLNPTTLAHTLTTTRTHHDHRATITGHTHNDLLTALTTLTNTPHHTLTNTTTITPLTTTTNTDTNTKNENQNQNNGTPRSTGPHLITGTRQPNPGKTVFVYPGQGSQWPAMATELLTTSPLFAHHIDACAEAINPHTDYNLHDVLRQHPNAPTLDRLDVVQPALFAVMTALTHLWRHHDIHPHTVIGHSQGEITAAHAAGALTLHDAAHIITHRSKLLTTLTTTGHLISLPLPHHETQQLLTHHPHTHIAATNGPTTTIIAGTTQALHHLQTTLHKQGIKTRTIPATVPSHSPHVEPLHQPLLTTLHHITPQPTTTNYCSGMTGDLIDPTQLTAEYWYQNMRQPVRFHHATQTLLNTGHRLFIEISPHPVLTTALTHTTETHTPTPHHTTITPTLHRNQPTTHQFTTALATTHTHGTTPTWHHTPPPTTTPTTPLPTYPFQRTPYWLHLPPTTTNPTHHGQTPTTHPLLTAAIHAADTHRTTLTGRINTTTHPYLTDHAVNGTPLLPATGHLDLALFAAAQVGLNHVEELALEAPLVLPERKDVDLQVTVGPDDGAGRRPLTIHSRPAAKPSAGGPDDASDIPWTRHATGTLTTSEQAPPAEGDEAWPPAGTAPIDLDGFYERIAQHGYHYGPVFQGLTAAWNGDDHTCAEAALPEGTDTAGYGIHPALLDAALQGSLATLGEDAMDQVQLPFSWRGVTLHASGPAALRAHLTPTGSDSIALRVLDGAGQPVVTVDALTVRPLDTRRLASAAMATPRDSLYQVTWSALPGGSVGVDAGELRATVVEVAAPEAVSPAAAAHSVVHETLALIQRHVTGGDADASPLVLLTHGAIATTDDEDITNLPAAAAWGLTRSAQSEHPGRILLIDTDHTPTSHQNLTTTITNALTTGEPQLALRNGNTLVPRLTRTTTHQTDTTPPTLNPNGTILITGGTGTLGAAAARHLVSEHGARHLLLASRSGPNAPGAHELQAELTAHGAHITLTTCDTGNPHQLSDLLAAIPDDHPLTAVIHTAGTLHDATLDNLTPDHIDTVLHPKADTAWHLHHLTQHLDLAAFVLYSSVAGTLGSPGQAAYAAANTFLDALATHRHTHGLPATSLAWGLWEETSALTGSLSTTDLARMHRTGMLPMPTDQALALLDAALATGRPALLPAHLNHPVLRAQSGGDLLPRILRALYPAPVRQAESAGAGASLVRRLAGVEEAERLGLVLELTRGQVAAVLGHADAESVAADQAFQDLGFDSLTAVELRNRLTGVTGLRLPATAVFDHPTPAALAEYLLGELAVGAGASSGGAVLRELDSLEAALEKAVGGVAVAESERVRITGRLQALLANWTSGMGADSPGAPDPADGAQVEDLLESATADELFDFIDKDLGRSERDLMKPAHED